MFQRFLLVVLSFTAIVSVRQAEAVSVCYNNVCGRIVCQSGCVQRSVNGVCVVNHCTHPFREEATTLNGIESSASAGSCVSCSGGCCGYGYNFLSAERACKAACGAFGCFTRCQ